MYLLILLSLFTMSAAVAIIALMFDHPDHVVSSHAPYDEISQSYEMELRRMG